VLHPEIKLFSAKDREPFNLPDLFPKKNRITGLRFFDSGVN
jgi:hypothetical protein